MTLESNTAIMCIKLVTAVVIKCLLALLSVCIPLNPSQKKNISASVDTFDEYDAERLLSMTGWAVTINLAYKNKQYTILA